MYDEQGMNIWNNYIKSNDIKTFSVLLLWLKTLFCRLLGGDFISHFSWGIKVGICFQNTHVKCIRNCIIYTSQHQLLKIFSDHNINTREQNFLSWIFNQEFCHQLTNIFSDDVSVGDFRICPYLRIIFHGNCICADLVFDC